MDCGQPNSMSARGKSIPPSVAASGKTYHANGTLCPECGNERSLVLDSRTARRGVRRRMRCCVNGHRYPTVETALEEYWELAYEI